MEFSFQWYHETVRSSLINHEQSVRSPASQLPCLPPLLLPSPTVITDEVNIIWICKGLHKTVPGTGHVNVHWSISGLWMHNFWHWECCEAQQGLFRRIATSLSKPSPSYNPSWHSCINQSVFWMYAMPVSTAPGSDDSRQLLSSLRCWAEERPARIVHSVHTVHQQEQEQENIVCFIAAICSDTNK